MIIIRRKARDRLLLEFCVFNIFNSIFIAINWLIIMPIARYNQGERANSRNENKYTIEWSNRNQQRTEEKDEVNGIIS